MVYADDKPCLCVTYAGVRVRVWERGRGGVGVGRGIKRVRV